MRITHQSAGAIRRGTSIVEAVVVLAITLLFVFGGLDLGLAVTRYNALCEGARRAARSAAVHGSQASQLGTIGPTELQFTADSSNSIADSFRYVLATMNPADVQVTVEWPDANNRPDDRVQVTLQYQHRSILPSFLGFGPFNFRSVSVMSVSH